MFRNEAFLAAVRSTFLIFNFSAGLFISNFTFSSASAQAKEASQELEKYKKAPPVTAIVSATRREIAPEKSTRFVTVITREEIERSGKVYVIDLLRGQPGVSVVQSGPNGRTVSAFVRGTNANHTIIMVDGVQINSPTTGAADLADLTLENVIPAQNIDRIEILRGPQSTLYGSDALSGVVNIITKPGGEPGIHGNGRFEYGTHETFYEAGGLSGQWKRFAFSGSGARLDTEGPGENDDFEDTRGFGHGKINVTENSDLDIAFHYYNALAGIDDGSFRQDPNRWNKTRQQVLNTKYNFSLADWWQQYVQYSFFHDMLFSVDPRDPGTTQAESRFKLDTDRHTFEYQSNIYLGEMDVLTVGYEFEHGRSNNKTFDKIVRNHGWFLQNELTLWEIWTLIGGIRLDHHELFGTEASPLFSSGLWIAKTRTKLKGSFGKGFRSPSFNELFFPNFGNPALLPEKNWGWDAGFEQFYWDKKGSFSAAYFHNSIENLIQSVRVGSFLFQAHNVARARTQGVELEHKIRPWENLTLYTNYTYTDAVDKETHKRLTRRPWHQGKVGLTYDIWRFHLHSDWVLVGDRQDVSGSATRPPREKNPGYTRLDFMVSFDVTDSFQVYGRVENALNDHYDEVIGFDNPSTRFFVGTKAEF